MIREFLDNSLKAIKIMSEEATKKAIVKFPDHPKAQDVWVRLHSMNGGFEEAVKVLGLHREQKQYENQFNEYWDKKMHESIAILMNDFRDFLIKEVEENFFMFK